MSLDRETIRTQRNEKVARYLKYFGVIMAIFYFTLGLSFVFFPFIEGLSVTMRYAVCTLFILYGIFRLYRSLKS